MDPSDYYVVQGAQDSSFGTPTLYQASTSYFQQTPGATGMQRWGTYSSAVADPASQDGFWISNEYVTSTGVTIPSGLSAWWDPMVTNVQLAPYVPILGGAGTTATFTQGEGAAPLDPALTVKDRRQRDSPPARQSRSAAACLPGMRSISPIRLASSATTTRRPAF